MQTTGLSTGDLGSSETAARAEADTSGEELAPAGQGDGIVHAADPSPEVATSATVQLKGRANGVMIDIGEGDWSDVEVVLERRLRASVGFFRGGEVSLQVGNRALDEAALNYLRDLLAKYGLSLGLVHSASRLTFDSALQLGIASSMEGEDDQVTLSAVEAVSDEGAGAYFVYRGTLRSGQILAREESIIVLGDVNPGARLISGGDIFVWGRMRGIAYAGMPNKNDAVIACLALDEAIQLRISDVVAIAPAPKPESKGLRFWQRSAAASVVTERGPKIATVRSGHISVGPWDDPDFNIATAPRTLG